MSHVLAVSGTHIAAVILLSKIIFQHVFGRKISNFLTIFVLFGFVILSGASPSVIRAGIMAFLTIMAEILSRKSNVYNNLAISALGLLLYNPLLVTDMRFILSFGGTLGILLFQAPIATWLKMLYDKVNQKFHSASRSVLKTKGDCFAMVLANVLSVSLSAQLFLLPITWSTFFSVSFISVFTNLLVGPIAGLITSGGLLIYLFSHICFPLAKLLSYSVYMLVSFLLFVSKLGSIFPWANVFLATPCLWECLTYYLVLFYFFRKKQFKKLSALKDVYWKIIIGGLLLITIGMRVLPRGYIQMNVIDVGQGDSILLQTEKHKTILMDGGGSEDKSYDVGEKTLVPYLYQHTNGIIDWLMISHFHADHAGGSLAVIKQMKVKQIVIGPQLKETPLYKEFMEIVKEKQIPVTVLSAGDCVTIENLKISILAPFVEENMVKNEEKNENNVSLVVRIDYGANSILLTGDSEKEVEDKLIKRYAKNGWLDSTILKVAHHGSKTSSSKEFLMATTPKIACVSVGEKNRFGHPNQEVIERLQEVNAQIYRTDECGEIQLQIQKTGKIRIKPFLKNGI